MMSRRNELFELKSNYNEPLAEQRARSLLYFLAALAVLFLFVSLNELIKIIATPDVVGWVQLLLLSLPILMMVFFQMTRSGYYRQAAMGLVILSLLAMLGNLFPSNNINNLFLVLPILIAAALLGWRSTLITAGLVFVVMLYLSLTNASRITLDLFLWTSLFIALITGWLIVFGTNVQNLARRFVYEFEKLQRTAQRLHFRKSGSSEPEIALETINLLRDQLNITFASIYLIEGDDSLGHILGGLNLQQINVEHNVHLPLGNGINEAIRTRSIIKIKQDSSSVLREHLSQGTLAALAIPIIEEDELLGVLDVQSEDMSEFTVNEIEIIQLIVGQLALGLKQARLITALQGELENRDQIVSQQRERLLNYERSEQRATTSAWVSYLQQRGIEYMGFDFKAQNLETVLKENLDNDLVDALKTGEITMADEGDMQHIRVPITLRGQALGAMSFRVPKGSQTIGIRQQELIRSVVQRLALALENKRLFEQSHAQAQRESKANEIGSLLLSTTDIDMVLQLAADNFNQALGAIQTQIHLRPEASQIVEGEELS